tara:strand:+ start:2364 stop:2750 length:387 start_codon:yes stop_codon:yes gene_type:complete
MAKNEPSKPALYSRVKSEAKRKFKIFPSAYASAWIVKEYKKRGGTYTGTKSSKRGVARWMREKWTTQDGSPCGSAKFRGVKKCRPTVRISKETPVTWKELKAKGKASEAVREKKRVGMGKRTKAIKRD